MHLYDIQSILVIFIYSVYGVWGGIVVLLNKIDAAMKLGVSVELIEYFANNCPKSGENTKLIPIKTESDELYDESALIEFNKYLNSPWPFVKKGVRP